MIGVILTTTLFSSLTWVGDPLSEKIEYAYMKQSEISYLSCCC